jgi:GMP synthase-like glutamine amidotransferase
MKRALVFQHMDHDHPGRFADFFAEDGILPVPVRLFEGEAIPSLAGFDLLFVLGGAQDTWQEDEHPFLVPEKQAIREWVMDRAKPYLGVCLGHQLLATSLGGEVALGEQGEVGVFDVALTPEGERSQLLAGVPREMPVMQWHFAEVKHAPNMAQVLARSETTAVQTISIGEHALSTQFHCEFTPQSVAGWRSLPNYVAALERALGPRAYERLVADSYPLMPDMARHTRVMWDNFKKSSGLVT